MPIDIALTGLAMPLAEFPALAREAEDRGYRTAWVGEASGAEAIVLSTLIATHTKTLRIANGVIPVQTRTPVILGMATASLNHLAPGRFALKVITEAGSERVIRFAFENATAEELLPITLEQPGVEHEKTVALRFRPTAASPQLVVRSTISDERCGHHFALFDVAFENRPGCRHTNLRRIQDGLRVVGHGRSSQ